MAKLIDLDGLQYFKEQENAMIAAEYSSSNTYSVGNYCYHAGTLYRCTTAIATAEAWTAGHWTAAKLADDTSELKTALSVDEYSAETLFCSLPNFCKKIRENLSESYTSRGLKFSGSPFALGVNGTASGANLVNVLGDYCLFSNSTTPAATQLEKGPFPVINGHKYRLHFDLIKGTQAGNSPIISMWDTSGNEIFSACSNTIAEQTISSDTIGQVTVFFFKSSVFTNAVYKIWVEDVTLSRKLPDIVGAVSFTEYNGYFNSDGTIHTQSNTDLEKYTSKIPCKNGDVFKLLGTKTESTVSVSSLWCAYILYDKAGNVLGNRQDVVPTGNKIGYNTSLTISNTDAAYVAFTYRTFGDFSFVVERVVYSNDLYDKVLTLPTPQTASYGVDKFTVKSIAHAGYGEFDNGYPENTLPVFKLAKIKGFNCVECDVRQTSDNVPVLLHDTSINRTARNADGTEISSTINIADITYTEALTYDFGIGASSTYAGTKIPTFEEFIVFCKDENLYPYVEIQNVFTKSQVANLVSIVKSYHMERNVTWISFSESMLLYVKAVDDGARLGYLLNEAITSSFVDVYNALKSPVNEVFIDVRHGYVSSGGTLTPQEVEAEIEILKGIGCPMEVWTPDTNLQIQNVHNYCTGFTSNWSRFDLAEANFSDSVMIQSSTANSTKLFKITVDDSGTITATEYTR